MLKFKGLIIPDQQVEFLKEVYSIEHEGRVVFSHIEGKTVYDQLIENGATEENKSCWRGNHVTCSH